MSLTLPRWLVATALGSLLVGCAVFQRSPRPAPVPGAEHLEDPLASALERARRGRLDAAGRKRLAVALRARAREYAALGAAHAARESWQRAATLSGTGDEPAPRPARVRPGAHPDTRRCPRIIDPSRDPRPARSNRLVEALELAALGRQKAALRRLGRPPLSPPRLRWRARLHLLKGQRRAALRDLGTLRRRSAGGVRYLPALLRDLATLGLTRAGVRLARQLLHDGVRDPVLLRPVVGMLVAAGRPDAARIAVDRWAQGSGDPRVAYRFALNAWAHRGDGQQVARWARRLLLWDKTIAAPTLGLVVRALRQAGRPAEATRLVKWALRHRPTGREGRALRRALRPPAPRPRTAPPPAKLARRAARAGYAYRSAVAYLAAHRALQRGDRAAAATAFAGALRWDPARFGRDAWRRLAAIHRGGSLSRWIPWAILARTNPRSCPR